MKSKLRPIHLLKRRPRRPSPGRLRRGSVLIVVLVVILLLTYGVYGFTERMLAEARAAEAHGRAVQATAFAESGIEYAASYVAARAADPAVPMSLYHEPSQFGGVVVQESASAPAIGRFSLVSPVAGDTSYRQLRYGMSDESGKLNINAIAALGLDDTQQLTLLMSLPGMTEDIADAILDYLDEDDEPRLLGAESEYYETLPQPYSAKNGPLDSIEELLLVRGVTPELLYGEDTNRNGLLDPSENDGAASLPVDDADGVLRSGWHSFFTIYSRESNVDPEGEPKIDINQALLTELYDTIMDVMDDEEAAKFVVAYRSAGPTDPDLSAPVPSESNADDGDTPTPNDQEEIDALAGRVGGALNAPPQGTVTRAGMDLSKGAQFEIGSLYDLIDRQVEIEGEPVPCPFTLADILEAMPELNDRFALSESTAVEGRINVNEAPYEVLVGLPNMTPEIAQAIVAGRVDGTGQALSESVDRRTTAWLVAQDIVDLPTMRKLDRYLTARGDVFKVQSVGFFDGGGAFSRIEAVIDGSVTPAKIVSYRDITDLSRGYSPSQLLPTSGQTVP